MTDFQTLILKGRTKTLRRQAGVTSLTEAMIASIATIMIIGAATLGLRSTGTLISQSTEKATLRQNTVNGLRLMRSEIERSTHLLISKPDPDDETKSAFASHQEHMNINADRYADTLLACESLTGERTFKPIFGVKMHDLTNPVIYGLSSNINNHGYRILRCGAPLQLDGRYQESENIYISSILEDIGVIPCVGSECLESAEEPEPEEILKDKEFNFDFQDGFTPVRYEYEPALRIETDSSLRLIKLVKPTNDARQGEAILASFLEKKNDTKSLTKQGLYFAAFARADKQIQTGDEGSSILSGAFFQNVTSKKVRFVLDGSGSMSACVLWGDGYGSYRTFYSPERGRYIQTRRNCSFTRMESLQGELTVLLDNLSDDTKIGLRSFSTSGRDNHKTWKVDGSDFMRIGSGDNRQLAKDFVNSLDDASPTSWGGTNPWSAIQSAFEEQESDTLYFLSDGRPSRDRHNGSWQSVDGDEATSYYSNLNTGRSVHLKVNTTALGVEAPWMEKLAALTNGDHNQVDAKEIEESGSQ